jgi:uncharacterized protein YyaL (SSP411 family)
VPNYLSKESSPYLLQHSDNPVNWYPWGPEGLAIAKSEDKPIFLSIGYAACHWCHVMAHESFEDPETAAIMNRYFVNIKVDREVRPDLDSIYMQAVVAMTGQGGWPMSVFLTPDGEPFYGGTYFPPTRRYNMPSFREVLLTIARLWRDDRNRLLASGDQISKHLQQDTAYIQSSVNLEWKELNQAGLKLKQSYDWEYGGWGKAPKFPQPMTIEYLLRCGTRGDNSAVDMAMHALYAMSKGGMYDVVGGGFARYSTDNHWRTPHFEKMLYDNAQLALVYLHCWLMTGEHQFRRVCEETLDFLIREMHHHQGGFYSSLDADSSGEEGKFYVWSLEEIKVILDSRDDFHLFTFAYGISTGNNLTDNIILQRVMTDEQIAHQLNLPVEAVNRRLYDIHARLLAARFARVRPATDEKILTCWNGLALIAFSEAARYLDRDDYKLTAQRNATFILNKLYNDGHLLRTWREGQSDDHTSQNAFLEDYAALILGLLALYQTDTDLAWYTAAIKFADDMITYFAIPSENGSRRLVFYDTPVDYEKLLIRPRDIQDNTTPSGNALAVTALLLLATYEGRSDWYDIAEGMLSSVGELMLRYPNSFSYWLCAADLMMGPIFEVAIIDKAQDNHYRTLLCAPWKKYRPRLILAGSSYPPKPGSPALVLDRPLHNGLPTAYVCRHFICRQPTNSPEEMIAFLDSQVVE